MKRAPLPAPPADVAPPATADTARRRELVARSRQMGVPRGYGRERGLRIVAEPRTLAFIGYDISQRPQWLIPDAARAWFAMRADAAKGLVELQVVSAFRSVEYQVGIIERKVARGLAMADILKVSAAPGYSEHHSGRALDVTTPGFAVLEEEFERSPAFAWLVRHAGGYGFALSYPRGNPHAIAYEPWHWCWHRRRV